ncbi:MAG: hypothetical protein ACTMI6_07990 [Pseudomonas bubulae]
MLKPLNQWIRRTVLLPLTALSLVATAHAQTVTIGVQSMFAPWKDAIAQKQFEQATGWDIQWRNFDSGGDVMMAMASGDVQIGVAGSSPIAAAVSRGVDAQLFWILDNIADAGRWWYAMAAVSSRHRTWPAKPSPYPLFPPPTFTRCLPLSSSA